LERPTKYFQRHPRVFDGIVTALWTLTTLSSEDIYEDRSDL